MVQNINIWVSYQFLGREFIGTTTIILAETETYIEFKDKTGIYIESKTDGKRGAGS